MSLAEMIASPGRKRILALDGGGIKGIFTIEVLARIEKLLREYTGNDKLVLADHFHLMAGTSTGAIIATLLSWGETVDSVRDLYIARCHEIFPKIVLWRFWQLAGKLRAFYPARPLSTFLREHFREGEDGPPAELGTSKLRTLLLLCMRNASTGSAWPITNNPRALYNDPASAECNLRLPLWQLVRASTAAPIYFLPERISVGSANYAFVDGGVTPYNNPSVIAFLTATLASYRVGWPTGTDKLHVVSVGTGRTRSILRDLSFRALNLGTNLTNLPAGYMESISLQQDMLCRVFGQCLFGDRIDGEFGDLVVPAGSPAPDGRAFTYVRYDHTFHVDELVEVAAKYGQLNLSNLRIMPYLAELGTEYAKNVKLEHLL